MNYKQEATEARLKILEMIHKAQTSHIASNFSVVDIATVLYANLNKNDDVVWSKGWASASIYYFLAKQGKIPKEDLERFAKEEDGKIEYLGLAETNVNGVLCNGGAVGHGLPIAVGRAYAKKLSKEEGIVYCILSDGELNEGTVWESAMLAKQLNLNNLCVFVDSNKWQAMGKTKDVIDLDAVKAFEGFGWTAKQGDGHDYEVLDRMVHVSKTWTSPLAFICDTIKGYGGDTACDIFAQGLLYHYKHVDKETYQRARELLGKAKM